MLVSMCLCVFFFKQKTAYEMRMSDWSSDVCSSDLWREDAGERAGDVDDESADQRRPPPEAIGERAVDELAAGQPGQEHAQGELHFGDVGGELGRASCRERVRQYV